MVEVFPDVNETVWKMKGIFLLCGMSPKYMTISRKALMKQLAHGQNLLKVKRASYVKQKSNQW